MEKNRLQVQGGAQRPTRPRTRSGPDGQDRVPPELVEEIIGFVLRPDWRTCKRHEAEHIEYNHGLVLDYLDQTKENWGWDETYAEVDGWTLYGRRWLMDAHTWLVVAPGRPPLIPPTEGLYTDEYWKWYSHRIQWING
jgi:hypothetical protein